MIHGAQTHAARKFREQRSAGLASAATDHGDGAIALASFNHAVHDPHGPLLGVALLEEHAAGRGGADGDFLRERGEVFALQPIKGRESLEQVNAGFAFFGHWVEPDAISPEVVRRKLCFMVAQDFCRPRERRSRFSRRRRMGSGAGISLRGGPAGIRLKT